MKNPTITLGDIVTVAHGPHTTMTGTAVMKVKTGWLLNVNGKPLVTLPDTPVLKVVPGPNTLVMKKAA